MSNSCWQLVNPLNSRAWEGGRKKGGNPLQAAIKLVRHEQAAQKHSEENRSVCLHWQKPWCTSSHAACLNIWLLWLAWCKMCHELHAVCVLHVPVQKWQKPHLSHIFFSPWISCSEENLTRLLLIHIYLGYLKCSHNESASGNQTLWHGLCDFVDFVARLWFKLLQFLWPLHLHVVCLNGVTSCHLLSHVICLVSWSALVYLFFNLALSVFFLFLQYLLVFLVLYLSWISFFKIKLAFCFALFNQSYSDSHKHSGMDVSYYISVVFWITFFFF